LNIPSETVGQKLDGPKYMNTVADIEFKVKGKTVSSDRKKISALPEDERRKAFARMKALGSTVAGFSSMETPKMPPTVMPTMAARERSPSPKPKKEEPKKEEPKNRLAKLFGTVGKAIKGLTPSDYQESETYGDSLRQYRIPNSAMPTGAKNASEDLLGYKISTQTIGFDGAKYKFQPTATEFLITVEPNKASDKTVVFRDAFKNAAMILSDDERISDKIEEIYRGAHKELQAKRKK